LLNDFLCLGKLEEGKINAVSSMFSLKDMLDHIVTEFDGLKKEGQHIALDYEPGGSHFVSSDRQLIQNILLSLLSNAVKYSSTDSTITVSVRKEGSALMLEVKDQGIGIPLHEQSHIFDRFFRAKNAIDIEGTGLGLNIVKNYVELLHGDITFTSIENEGTSFSVRIPLAQVPEAAWQ
jgi:signal transduction histidine kinase